MNTSPSPWQVLASMIRGNTCKYVTCGSKYLFPTSQAQVTSQASGKLRWLASTCETCARHINTYIISINCTIIIPCITIEDHIYYTCH
jgi:hypothetical protein